MDINDVATLFGVSPKNVDTFDRMDPFTNNKVKGFICRKRNKNGGSLVITNVNGKDTTQIIWATPKLAYPYKENSTDYIEFKNVHSFTLIEKWNGMNVLFYKYYDDKNNPCVTAKSKGTPFINDGENGNFLTLVKEAMNKTTNWKVYFDNWMYDPSSHAISFELCGTKEPHLVAYEFALQLKPLFTIHKNGKIRPILHGSVYVVDNDTDIVGMCKYDQEYDFKKNEGYRKSKGLTHKYEYNHFITEGKVLYLLDKDGFVINDTMYKIKPKDIEEVHWARFDETMQERVNEAVNKCKEREYSITLENIQQELDMGPKEWSKFGKAIEKYLKEQKYNI